MNRRDLVALGLGAAVATVNAGAHPLSYIHDAPGVVERRSALRRTDVHRFGVNYTPSHKWWFCWNDWDTGPIKKDLD